MPLAAVDRTETQLYYEDTGAPIGRPNYRTLVLVHGGVFNGGKSKLLRTIYLMVHEIRTEANIQLSTSPCFPMPQSTAYDSSR